LEYSSQIARSRKMRYAVNSLSLGQQVEGGKAGHCQTFAELFNY